MKLYQNLNVTGSLTLTGSLNTIGTITATTLVVQTITSSISAITGSTKFGELSTNTHQFTGSMYVTGALYVPIGSVGIGTTTPLSKFDISVGNQISSSLGLFSVSGTSITSTGGSTGNLYQIAFGYGGGTYAHSTIAGLTESSTGYNAGALIFATRTLTTDTAPIERMRITSGGNVGIGTSSPNALLDVRITSYTPTGHSSTLLVEETSAWTQGIAISQWTAGTYNSSYPSGFIGIANTGASITISGGARIVNNTAGTLWAKTVNSTSAGFINVGGNTIFYTDGSLTANTTYTPTERMRITSGGNVLIGVQTDTTEKLQVNGVSQFKDTLLSKKSVGNSYAQTSTSGTTSIVDTGIYYNTSIIGYGIQSIYQVTIAGNPQNAGSASYRNTILGYISIQTGYSGAVTQEITWNQIFSNAGNGFTAFTVTVRFWNGTSETTSIADGTTNAQIRIKVAGYNGTVGSAQDLRILKITD